MGRFDYERAADGLIDALMLSSDKKAAKKHGVTVRTLQRWRKRQQEDADLAYMVGERLKSLAEDELTWNVEASRTIKAAFQFIQRATEELDPQNIQHVQAVTESLKVVVDADIALRILHERLREISVSQTDDGGQVSAGAGGYQVTAWSEDEGSGTPE